MSESLQTMQPLVAGAAQGIGQAITAALAEGGAQVIATTLTPPHETVA